MKKAAKLLTMFTICALLLASTAAYAAPEPEDAAPALPAGTVYTVGTGGDRSAATTVVDYVLDGGDEAEAGLQCDSGSGYYYGAEITGVTCGAVIGGVDTCYFGSSTGAIPLYNDRGAVSGIVWGDRRATVIDSTVGLLLTGDISRQVFVEDGTSITCREAVIRCQSGSGSFRFYNAHLDSASGVLCETGADAGDIAISYGNGAYRGDHINGGGSLSITVGRGALLSGDTAAEGCPVAVTVSAGGTWVVQESAELTSLTVEDGGTVYGALTENEDGSLALLPADTPLDAGTYEAQALAEDLPFGPGPAVPEDEPEASEQTDGGKNKLFPLVPGDAAPVEEEAAPTEEEAPAASEPAADGKNHLFPLTPDADLPEDPAASEEAPVPDLVISTTAAVKLRSALADSVTLACRSALHEPMSATPSIDLAAQIASRSPRLPAAAALLKTGAKTHSFLPEAIDNRAIILYNPYCCLAA